MVFSATNHLSMPKQHQKIKCFAFILEYLKAKGNATFKQVQDKLAFEGFEISSRTLQRYFEQIRNELGFEIEYNNEKGRYNIKSEDLPNVATFIKLVVNIQTADFVQQVIETKGKVFNHVDVDTGYSTTSIQILPTVLKAILQHKLILIKHQSFSNNSIKSYTLQPYLIKEFLYRWYLVSIDNSTGNIRNFGIDRISSLQVLSEKFKPTTNYDFKKLYSSTVGVNYGDSNSTKIVFKCDKILSKYLETSPIHSSQKKIKSEGDICFELDVTINTELKQRLLSFTPQLTIISPGSLKGEIIQMLQKALVNYNQ